MQASVSGSGQGIFFDQGKPLRIYLASDIENHTTLVNSLRAAGALTTFSPGDAQIVLVSRGTQVASELLCSFPDKLFLDVAWAHAALRNGQYATHHDGWGGHFVHPVRSELQDAGPLNTSPLPTPRRTPVPTNDMHAAQQPLSATSIDPTLLVRLYQTLLSLPTTSQTTGLQSSNPAFQPPPGVILPFPSGPSPSGAQGNVGIQPSNVSQDVLGLFNQLLGKAAHDESSQNQFQAHQWPSQGISNPFAAPSSFPHLPYTHPTQHSTLNGDLANTIVNSLRSTMNPAPTASASKRKSWQDSDMPSPDEEMGETGHSTKRERLDSEDLSLSRLKHTGHGSRNKRVFVDEAGAPLAFYVLPSLKRRHEYVDAIKKHGGIITTDVLGSNFVVLSLNVDHFYETLRSAIASDVPAVKPDFIVECIKSSSLLDEADFSFDGETFKKKRGLPIHIDLEELRRETHGETKQKGTLHQRRKRPRDTPEDGEKSSMQKKDKPQKYINQSSSPPKRSARKSVGAIPKAQVRLSNKREPNESQVNYKTPRSPSPVAPNTIVEFAGNPGKHRYTTEEREYWPILVAHVLKYDPHCTQQRLAQLLAERMPHHSAPSWSTAILMKHRDTVEDLRKKAFIDARKAGALRNSPANNVEQSCTEGETSGARVNAPVPRQRTEDLEADLEIVTQFLMAGGAEEIQDDSDVWKTLQAQQPCRTEQDWEAFWEEHGEEVTKEIEDRTAVDAEVKVEMDA